MPSIIDQLVSHVLDTPFEAFNEETILAAKKRLIDALGCTVSGAGASGNDAMLNIFSEWGGAPQATVLGSGTKLPLPHAAMVNSLQTRSFDFEVCGPEPEGINKGKMVGHVASTTEPLALNVGEYTHATGKEMLAAVILGGDVAARISVSNTFNFDADFEVCGTSNAFGADAVAGRLMGLNHDQLRNAFGIAAEPDGRFLPGHLGRGAFLQASRGSGRLQRHPQLPTVARRILGVQDALESRLGYFNLYCADPHPDVMLADLGSTFYVKGQHKLHPSCYGNHNPIECALLLRDEHGFTAEEVRRSLPRRAAKPDRSLPEPGSHRRRPAAEIPVHHPLRRRQRHVRGRPELEHYVAPAIHDPAVLDLAARVKPCGRPARRQKPRQPADDPS